MRHDGGVVLAFLYVVAALHGCGASSACPPTVAAVGTSSRQIKCSRDDRKNKHCEAQGSLLLKAVETEQLTARRQVEQALCSASQ